MLLFYDGVPSPPISPKMFYTIHQSAAAAAACYSGYINFLLMVLDHSVSSIVCLCWDYNRNIDTNDFPTSSA